MSSRPKRTNAGGAATTAGTTFQEDVARWFACFILAETGVDLPLGLPSGCCLEDLIAETTQPIDDIRVGASGGGQILIQAKTRLTLPSDANSTFASVLEQFVRQYQDGLPTADGTGTRAPDNRDRFVLAVSHTAPATIQVHLKDALDRVRSARNPSLCKAVHDSMSGSLRRALDTFTGKSAVPA